MIRRESGRGSGGATGTMVSEVVFEGSQGAGPAVEGRPGGAGAQDGEADQLGGGLFVGEVSAGLDRLADVAVEVLDAVGNRYERRQMLPVTHRLDAVGVRVGEYGATVRGEGIRGVNAGRAGRSSFHGPR